VFERYTEGARRVLFFARYEASNFGSLQIEPEHLLLGVLRRRGLSQRLGADAGLTYKVAVAEIRKQHPPREKVSTSVEMPFSETAKASLHAAAREADDLGHSYIGSEHLLLGVLHADGTTAKAVLESHGIRLPDARQQVEIRTVLEEAEGGSPRRPEGIEVDVYALQERLIRIEELMQQVAAESHEHPRVIELLQAIRDELADLRLPPND
jgi:ATP-dependent Clp protease ATP-binding subunit ClpC